MARRPEADDRAQRLANGARYLVVNTIEEAVLLFPDKLHVAIGVSKMLRWHAPVIVRFTPGKFEVWAAASAADVKATCTPAVMKTYVDAINEAIDRAEPGATEKAG